MKKRLHPRLVRLLLLSEKFVTEQLWQIAIVVGSVAVFAWLFDKPAQAVMFCVAHLVIRNKFDKQYHCGTTALCLITTLSIAFFGIAAVLPFSVSLLSAIPVCFVVCYAGYIAQDRIDLLQYRRFREEQDRSIRVWGMPESELRQFCQENMLDSIDTEIVVCRLVHHLSGRSCMTKSGTPKHR